MVGKQRNYMGLNKSVPEAGNWYVAKFIQSFACAFVYVDKDKNGELKAQVMGYDKLEDLSMFTLWYKVWDCMIPIPMVPR